MTAMAWLLTLEDGTPVAVGERELMHIVSDELERSFIPMAPEYAREVIAWQSRLIPLFNAAAVLRRGNFVRDLAAGVPGSGAATIIAIAAYQVTKESRVELGALSLGGLPERIEVADDSGCALPPEQPGWRRLAHSCYQHSQLGAVPILDLCRMFAPGARGGQGLNQSTRH